MTIDIESRLLITDEAWCEHVQGRVVEYQKSYFDEDVDVSTVPSYEPWLNFLSTGELSPLLENAEVQGYPIEWHAILATNPSRDMACYQHNISQYWDWVLKDEESRMPRRHRFEEPVRDNFFWAPLSDLYSGNGKGLCDPGINKVLFDRIFGKIFQTQISFPQVFGNDRWCPQKALDPNIMFAELMRYLQGYLFLPHTGFAPGMILITLDYWFSMIPLIRESFFSESGYFGLRMDHDAYLDYEMSEEEELIYQGQDSVRRFFGLLNGYQVCREEDGDELCDNDPEICSYLRDRFASLELPDEYHALLEFLHQHRENALQV